MVLSSEGGPYTLVSSTECVPNAGSGQLYCFAANEAAFQRFPSSSDACVIRDGMGIITSINVTDGDASNGTILLMYDVATNPAPNCSSIPPFTNSPSAAPTETPTPTADTTHTSHAQTILGSGLLPMSIMTLYIVVS